MKDILSITNCMMLGSLMTLQFILIVPSTGQQFQANQITTKNGLTNNSINALYEDGHGYIWIGTDRGVQRYDGYKFEDIGINWDHSGYPISCSVNHFIQDTSGHLIIATDDGVVIADPARFETRLISMVSVNHLFLDSWQNIYCITKDQGLNKLVYQGAFEWKIDSTFPLQNFDVFQYYGRAAISQFQQKLWLGAKTGGLFVYDLLTKEVKEHFFAEGDSIKQTTSLLVDHLDRFWVGTYDGLYQYNHLEGQFHAHLGDPDTTDEANSEKVLNIYEDKSNRLWISRENHLSIYNSHNNSWQRKWFFANNVQVKDPIFPSLANALADKPCYNLVIGTSAEDKIWSFSTLDNMVHREQDRGSELSGNGYLSGGPHKPQGRIIITGGLVDRSGMVWIGTESDGIFTFNTHPLPYTHFKSVSNNELSLDNDLLTSLEEDLEGNLWVGQWEDELFLLKDKLFIPLALQSNSGPSAIKINVIKKDRTGNLWVGTTEGIFKIKLDASTFSHNFALGAKVEATSTEYSKYLPQYAVDGNLNTRWASLMYAPQDFIIDLKKHCQVSRLLICWHTLPQSYQVEISQDRNQWHQVETRLGNVHRYDQISIKQTCRFIRIRALERSTIFNISISEIYALGTQPEIIYLKSDKAKNAAKVFVNDIIISDSIIYALSSTGLGIVGINDHDIRILKIGNTSSYFPENHLVEGRFDKNGALWMVNQNRTTITLFNPITESFVHSPLSNSRILPKLKINKLVNDQAGLLYLLTNHGIWRVDQTSHEIELRSPDLDILDVFWGTDQSTWLGTNGQGLFVAYQSQEFRRLESEILPNQIASIKSDKNNNLWIGSVDGLFRIDANDGHIYQFSDQGETSIPDLSGPSIQDQNGKIYYIHDATILEVEPDLFERNTTSPAITITSIKVNDAPIALSGSLNLTSKENNLEFDFSAMHHDKTEKNTYSYRVSPIQDHWTDWSTQHRINLSGLMPGKYDLLIKACNGDNTCMETPFVLAFKVNWPWYLRWWSLTTWSLLLLLMIRYYLYSRKESILVSQQLAFERRETTRLRELDKTKSRFFTNVSHEFRTPLTIIAGIARQIQGSSDKREVILKNTETLQRQINHILDLSKLDAGQLEYVSEIKDIIKEIKEITQSFTGSYSDKQIHLSLDFKPDQLFFEYDSKMLEAIVYNLISNAIKFTPSPGSIEIETYLNSKDQFVFSIKDTGPGIPKNLHDKIFHRFFQVNDSSTRTGEGSGLGLAIVKEFITKLQGQIIVANRLPQGTHFQVKIPVKNRIEEPMKSEVLSNNKHKNLSRKSKFSSEMHHDKAFILIVEDNYDMAHYLQSILSDYYNLRWAKDGAEGIKLATHYIPDLILSDIMMPQMDGLELADRLHNDHKTSHIPIIFLTAKATNAEIKEGLTKGALSYLTKPFDESVLRSTIENTLYLRDQIIQHLKSVHSFEDLNIPERREFTFLQELNQILKQKASEEEFDSDALANSLAMSTSQLYRKLKAITGHSVADYIKEFRLFQAKELLEKSDLSVSVITLQVGFRSLTYFSRIFKERFGQSPTSIRKNESIPDSRH